jgi:hypothetical protein
MLTIQHATARITCTEANAPMYRAIIDSGKPRKFKRGPDASIKRDYPDFRPGMTTGEYLSRYASLNNRIFLAAIKYDHAERAAPMLDAQWPEVTEELDPDYTAPAPATKARKTTPAQLRKALENIAAIEPMATANVHDLWLAIGEIRRIAEGALK